jgi:predicted transposase/invertase (TIGR01784 family)
MRKGVDVLARQVLYPWELPRDARQVAEELKLGKVNRLMDSVFKFVFCKEERIPIFLDLINALVFPDGERAFKTAHFLDRELSPSRYGGKGGRFDALALMDAGDTVNLEVQASTDPAYLKRVVTYTCWLHGSQLDKGKKYYEAKPTISVNILGFDHFKSDKSFSNSFSFRNDKSGKKLNDDLGLFFFEIPKFMRSVKVAKTKQERWLAYFAGMEGEKMEQVASQEPMISDALVAERFFAMDRETRLAYMMEWKHIMDEEAREARYREAEAKYRDTEAKYRDTEAKYREAEAQRKEAEAQRKEAEARAKVAKIEIARNLLANGASTDLIAQSTGLSRKAIQRLAK